MRKECDVKMIFTLGIYVPFCVSFKDPHDKCKQGRLFAIFFFKYVFKQTHQYVFFTDTRL